jgi:general secretion pathway protein J
MKLRSREAGVTLVELIIAVSLVSFLSLGMLFAIRVGLSAMDKTNARFLSNRKVMAVQRIINGQIGGIMPVLSNCQTPGGPKFVFFQGQPQLMTFVSSYSLQEGSRGYPHILDFRVIPGEQGLRLIVNESIYPGPITAGRLCMGLANGVPVLNGMGPNPASFVLADKLAFCRILYRKTLPPPDPEVWLPVWTVADRLPSGIRIEMAPIAAEPAHLQTLTITAPVHVTKWVLGPYADN